MIRPPILTIYKMILFTHQKDRLKFVHLNHLLKKKVSIVEGEICRSAQSRLAIPRLHIKVTVELTVTLSEYFVRTWI